MNWITLTDFRKVRVEDMSKGDPWKALILLHLAKKTALCWESKRAQEIQANITNELRA